MADPVPYLEFIVVPLTAFLLGIGKGLLTCAIFCAPGLIPMVMESKASMARAFKIGVLFNLPRITALTIAGALLGLIIFAIGSQSFIRDLVGVLNVWTYFYMGIFICFIGARMFYTARVEANMDKKDCTKCRSCKFKPKTDNKKDNMIYLMWGSFLSIACIGEIFILEGAIITTAGSLNSTSLIAAGLMGAAGMFAFGLGASVPVIAVLLASSKAGTLVGTPKLIRNMKVVCGAALVILGLRIFLQYLTIIIAYIYTSI